MNQFTMKRRGYEVSTLILNERGQTVAEVFTNREPGDQYETAALFAAAPELLAALQSIVEEAGPLSGLGGSLGTVNRISRIARAAIAKATQGGE